MQPIPDFENIQATEQPFESHDLQPGCYLGSIEVVRDHTAENPGYLEIVFWLYDKDGHRLFDESAPEFVRSCRIYTSRGWGYYKHFVSCVEKTERNKGYKYPNTTMNAEQTLSGKFLVFAIGERLYLTKNGEDAVSTYVGGFYPESALADGSAKVPKTRDDRERQRKRQEASEAKRAQAFTPAQPQVPQMPQQAQAPQQPQIPQQGFGQPQTAPVVPSYGLPPASQQSGYNNAPLPF